MNIDHLKTEILREVHRSLKEIYKQEFEPLELGKPPENVDAEFSLGCFVLAKQLHRNPAEIAREVAQNLRLPLWVESVKGIGPYLNFKIHVDILHETVLTEALNKKDTFGYKNTDNPETILVEYSSPNTNKPLHLGHIRNNVLGMAVVNLLKSRGHNVIPASIMNDRGIHICKAMVGYLHFAEEKTPEELKMKGDHFVGWCYVQFEMASRENPALMEEARNMLRAWESENPEVVQLWKKMNEWVYRGFHETYGKLGSKFDLIQYESILYKLGKKIVNRGLESGVFYRKDDGSVWFDLSGNGLDEKAIIRSDGTSLYVTQDLGVALERFENYNLDRSIYVVASEQDYHFRGLLEILKRLDFSWANRCRHLSYGMVFLPEGKMKSREGKVVDADQLIDQMRELSLRVMEKSHIKIDMDNPENIAEAVGMGAIKYYILKFNPKKSIHFDPEQSLSFEGATGAYIQYTFARIQSLLKKAGISDLAHFEAGMLETSIELEVTRNLMRYPEVLETSTQNYNPSRLAGYLWELAKSYNVFYTHNPVIKAEQHALKKARLSLSAAVAACLKSGLNILGIEAVTQM